MNQPKNKKLRLNLNPDKKDKKSEVGQIQSAPDSVTDQPGAAEVLGIPSGPPLPDDPDSAGILSDEVPPAPAMGMTASKPPVRKGPPKAVDIIFDICILLRFDETGKIIRIDEYLDSAPVGRLLA